MTLIFFTPMKKTTLFKNVVLASMLLLGLSACKEEVPKTNSDLTEEMPDVHVMLLEAEDYVDAGSAVSIENTTDGKGQLVLVSGESWLAYDVDVAVAGRYKIEVHAWSQTDTASIWMEDYIDNTDGRTYNITGSMFFPASASLAPQSKDGSPLNKGIHKMKLHLKGNMIKVDWVRFTLLKEHQQTPSTLTQNMNGESWKLVWSDEFEGTGLPDTSKWIYDIGDWGWGNNELQYYTENRLENARQENGNLIIEARKGDMGKVWTSARLTTRGKQSFLYGRIEFRAKVPVNRGNWAAGWTLGDDYVDERSWPYCGEIDVLECVGYEIEDESGLGKAHASVHCGAYYFKLGNQPTSIVEVPNMNQEYHTYTIDWSPKGIIAYVDDSPYFTYEDTSTELSWPFDKPQNIILNLAIGGGWGGLQGLDESMTSQELVFDYVRVYEKQ
ncbi:MAG: family 16 glycosylhydrolase [Saprospiraceae bacterium]|nr:family 16 glycosylhydrolase [Saprospiraceae bacterium]